MMIIRRFLGNSLLILAAHFGAIGIAQSSPAEQTEHAQVEITKASQPASPSSSSGRSGISGGISGNALIELGGVDEHGLLVKEALVLPLTKQADGSPSKWLSLPISDAQAWAATAQHGDELILAGGLLNGAPSAKVSRITWKDGKFDNRDLPPLPKPVIGAGAAIVCEKL